MHEWVSGNLPADDGTHQVSPEIQTFGDAIETGCCHSCFAHSLKTCCWRFCAVPHVGHAAETAALRAASSKFPIKINLHFHLASVAGKNTSSVQRRRQHYCICSLLRLWMTQNNAPSHCARCYIHAHIHAATYLHGHENWARHRGCQFGWPSNNDANDGHELLLQRAEILHTLGLHMATAARLCSMWPKCGQRTLFHDDT